MKRQSKAVKNVGVWRLNLVRLMFIALVLALGWRLADIQILNTDFYEIRVMPVMLEKYLWLLIEA